MASPAVTLASRVVVVLDTSVLRNFAAGDDDGRGFRKLINATPVARFCLSDTAAGELGLWLARAGEE